MCSYGNVVLEDRVFKKDSQHNTAGRAAEKGVAAAKGDMGCYLYTVESAGGLLLPAGCIVVTVVSTALSTALSTTSASASAIGNAMQSHPSSPPLSLLRSDVHPTSWERKTVESEALRTAWPAYLPPRTSHRVPCSGPDCNARPARRARGALAAGGARAG